jgi:hypothetical protein
LWLNQFVLIKLRQRRLKIKCGQKIYPAAGKSFNLLPGDERAGKRKKPEL